MTTHLITLDKIKTCHLSKADLLDCLRLDNPGDSFEELPGGQSRWGSGFQVSRFPGFQVGLLPPGATRLSSPPARWACHASSGWFLPAPCAGAGRFNHNWCRKLHSPAADRPGGEPGTCHLGRPQPGHHLRRPQHQSEPESECTGNRPRQDISWKSRYFQPAIEIMFQYGRSCLFVFVWTMSNGQFPLDMYEHACTCVKENLDVFATCL